MMNEVILLQVYINGICKISDGTMYTSTLIRRFRHTFIIRMSVLSAIIVRMKYSNGVETTSCQIRYLIDRLFFGM